MEVNNSKKHSKKITRKLINPQNGKSFLKSLLHIFEKTMPDSVVVIDVTGERGKRTKHARQRKKKKAFVKKKSFCQNASPRGSYLVLDFY